jgi:hypothetical protein
MILPTVAGLVSEPLNALTLAADDVTTGQQVVDAAYGGVAIGAVAMSLRDASVVRKTLGEPAVAKFKGAKIAGII